MNESKENCTCTHENGNTCCGEHEGHDHDSCCHEHEHHHHHEGCSHHHNKNQVMVGTMSNATIGTLTAFTTDNISVTEVGMHLILKELASWVKEQGGMINQLKCSIKNEEMTVVLSMLGNDIFRKEGKESTETTTGKVKINLMNILFNIEPTVLKVKLEEILTRLVKK